MRLHREILPARSLSAATIDEYYRCYAAVAEMPRDELAGSLAHKDYVIGWRDGAGALRGMLVVGIAHERHPATGRAAVLFGTHHAAMDPSLRGKNLLQMVCLRFWTRLRLRHPRAAIYWLFDTYSYKSYLSMTHTFRRAWPRRDEPMPEAEAALVDAVMSRDYPGAWDRARGVLVWQGWKLRPGVADVARGDLSNPEIAYFAAANPGSALGHTLVCLCPLTVENLAGAAVDRLILRRRS